MLDLFLSTPLFGLTLSFGMWCVGLWVQKKTKCFLFSPIIVATGLVIAFLSLLDIPYATYMEKGGSMLALLLGPVTAVLALNIYNQRKLLGKYFLPVVVGCLAGSLASIGSVLLLCRLVSMDSTITNSLLPKSVTTAIAVAISQNRGGVAGITTASVIVAGQMGALFAPSFAKLFRITDPVAEGVAIGACSHALGTTKALEIGELQGAMSSIAICICGIITSVLVLFL